jgi:hypothetical protein
MIELPFDKVTKSQADVMLEGIKLEKAVFEIANIHEALINLVEYIRAIQARENSMWYDSTAVLMVQYMVAMHCQHIAQHIHALLVVMDKSGTENQVDD